MKVMTCQIEAVNFILSETHRLFLSEASLELSLLCIHSADSSPTSSIPLSQLCLDLVSVSNPQLPTVQGKRKGVTRIKIK